LLPRLSSLPQFPFSQSPRTKKFPPPFSTPKSYRPDLQSGKPIPWSSESFKKYHCLLTVCFLFTPPPRNSTYQRRYVWTCSFPKFSSPSEPLPLVDLLNPGEDRQGLEKPPKTFIFFFSHSPHKVFLTFFTGVTRKPPPPPPPQYMSGATFDLFPSRIPLKYCNPCMR